MTIIIRYWQRLARDRYPGRIARSTEKVAVDDVTAPAGRILEGRFLGPAVVNVHA